MLSKTIRVNGVERTVAVAYLDGPGGTVQSYDLRGGNDYVYRVGAAWMHQRSGQFAAPVTVEVAS